MSVITQKDADDKREVAPLVSFVLFAYNQEKYVEAALRSALSQEYPHIEYLISDDCSKDGTFAEMERIVEEYKSSRTISLFRNKVNKGLIPHVNTLLFSGLVHGEIIVLASGDDLSVPGRVSDVVDLFAKNPRMMGTAGRTVVIDESGHVLSEEERYDPERIFRLDTMDFEKTYFMVGGSGLSFRKDVLSFFGKLNDDCQTEDSTFRFRCLLLGGIIQSKEHMILYKKHEGSISSNNLYKLQTQGIVRQYLTDLERARNASLITPLLYTRLKKSIKWYHMERYIREQASLHKNGVARFFFKALCGVSLLWKKIR